MKQWMLVVLVLVVASTWAQERVGMSVRTVIADPGEAAVDWAEDFFVDSKGHLVRLHKTVKGEFLSDPDTVSDTVFVWGEKSVQWTTTDGEFGKIEVLSDGIHRSVGASNDLFQFSRSGQEVRWQTGGFLCSWSIHDGFQSTALPGSLSETKRQFGYITRGSRLSMWYRGIENYRIILDRSPSKLLGTIVSEKESEPGWTEAGLIEVTGPGLWVPDPDVNAIHAIILNSSGRFPLWAPFVFEEKYLK